MLVVFAGIFDPTGRMEDFLIRIPCIGYRSSERGYSSGPEDVPVAFERSVQFNQPRLFEQRRCRSRRRAVNLGGTSNERSPGKLQRHF